MDSTYRDPITGDEITLGARISLLAQRPIRTWLFPIGNIILSVVWWRQPEWFGDDATLVKWMVLYSLLAVLIESIVGIGMRDQGNRDAVILREVRTVAREVRDILLRQEQLLAQVKAEEDQELVLLKKQIGPVEVEVHRWHDDGGT